MTKIWCLGAPGAIAKMAKNSYVGDKFGKIACAGGRGFVDLRERFDGGVLVTFAHGDHKRERWLSKDVMRGLA